MSAASDDLSRKRARVEPPVSSNAGNASASETKHDDEFWFEDGSIILIARNIEFRVYQGILASRSTVFRNMFTFPQPEPSSTSTVSTSPGTPCPFVHLPDSPEDIRELLRCLMPGKDSSTPFSSDACPTYQTVSACIRVGRGCGLGHLLDAALSFLRRYYPTDFAAYAKSPRPPPSFKPVHSIGIVNLARLTGAHDLLPIALYECCSLEAIELIGGFLRDDGTRESLSDNDIALCMRAQAALVKAHVERAISLMMATLCVPGHQPPLACKPALETLSYNNLMQIGTKVNARALAARPWRQQQQVPSVPTICAKCLSFLQRHDAAQQQQIWNSLPHLVGVTVENWKQLEVKLVPQAAVPPIPQVQGVGV